jgi:hypothetical protein
MGVGGAMRSDLCQLWIRQVKSHQAQQLKRTKMFATTQNTRLFALCSVALALAPGSATKKFSQIES